MEKKTLVPTDYVIYNPFIKDFLRFKSDNNIVIYGDLDEAYRDLDTSDGYRIVGCTDLPEESQQLIINQLNK
jgi:hypothetical protein